MSGEGERGNRTRIWLSQTSENLQVQGREEQRGRGREKARMRKNGKTDDERTGMGDERSVCVV